MHINKGQSKSSYAHNFLPRDYVSGVNHVGPDAGRCAGRERNQGCPKNSSINVQKIHEPHLLFFIRLDNVKVSCSYCSNGSGVEFKVRALCASFRIPISSPPWPGPVRVRQIFWGLSYWVTISGKL